MPKKINLFIIALVILALAVSVVLIGYSIYTRYSVSSITTLPAPLNNVEFASKAQQYPTDWPEDLRFPDAFILVDSSSGTLPESTARGWAAKLIFEGETSESANAVSVFLKEKGWSIVENHKLDSGGFILLIQRQQGSGIITLGQDPNNSSHTLIVASIFP